MKHLLSVFVLLGLSEHAFSGPKPSVEDLQFFEKKIRPVLVESCYECHSAAAAKANKLKGDLFLDSREGSRKGGESGPAVVPGDLDASLMISAIRHDSFQMPPDSKLKPDVIADFEKWIKIGAPDPREGEATKVEVTQIDIEAGRKFWSFQPLSDIKIPPVKNGERVANDVDRLILSQLEDNGLTLNSAANRRTLIRRLYFDLWGLPPEPKDVEEFINDPDPRAYENLVVRLLEGQHFGERWARHWLDLARFAESNGYAFDKDRAAAFHYRDFVIKAFNQDLPYDEFVRLQVAGDQLHPQDYMAQAATGFLASGPFTSQQTQKERERSRYEQLDDIVGTLGTSMLGLTFGCARCHDHKFDPLPTRDYYRLTAAFAATGFQDYDYDPEPAKTKSEKEQFDKAHQPFVKARVAYEKDHLPTKLDEWLTSNDQPPPKETLGVWQHIGPFPAANFKAAFNQKFAPEKNVDLTKPVGKLKWTPQPTWKDGAVHNTLTGTNSANYLYRTIQVAVKGPLEISLGRDDAIKVFLNGKQVYAKEVAGAAAPDQDKVTLQLNAGQNDLLVKIVNASGPSGFYFSTRPAIPKNIQEIIQLAKDKRNPKQSEALLKWFAPRDAGWSELNQAEQDHLKQAPKPKITKVFAARKNGATYNFGADTRKVYFLARGNANAKQGEAAPGFFGVLTHPKTPETQWLKPKTGEVPPRVALANWLTDDKHGAGHLLARVIVNRLWQHHFGRGIVATPSDFGRQGAAPTHPELLDYLAQELIRQGWRLKPIHKLILMSVTYQQSGETHADGQRIDPENLLWWRRPPMRLEAEIIRDQLLSVSGSLDTKMFGKGSLDQANPRRSVYLTVKRSNLIPILQLFDAPDSIQSIGHRNVTTVPPQALAMMNSAFIRKLAEKFAKRVRPTAEKPLKEVINSAYALALSRPPSDAELQQMTEFITTQAAAYGTSPEATDRAVADFCQTMFCLNEFVFID